MSQHGTAIDRGDAVKFRFPEEGGGAKAKAFSVCREEPGYFDICAKVYPNGHASGFLHHLQVGTGGGCASALLHFHSSLLQTPPHTRRQRTGGWRSSDSQQPARRSSMWSRRLRRLLSLPGLSPWECWPVGADRKNN